MSNDESSLIPFPCYFPIKIIGKNSKNFVANIIEVTRKYFPRTLNKDISSKKSNKGNYISVTVTIYVHNKEELDAFYLELKKQQDIKMVL